MDKALIFWLAGPPVCCKGVFDAVAHLWDGKVYYVLTRKIDENRAKITNGIDTTTCKAEYVFLNQTDNAESGMKFLKEHVNDVHVFNGYLGYSAKYLKELVSMNKNAFVIVWAERPCPRSVFGKSKIYQYFYNTVNKLRYRLHAVKLNSKVSALLPLGTKGFESYTASGWNSEKVFPFLYLPTMNETIPLSKIPDSPTIVKFVYLGRFSAGWKGTDVLIEACKLLKNSNFKLTMVGGYGDYKDETLDYINHNPNLEFGGTWKIDDACDKLSEFDVCIVPSRFEGWNVTVNEALMAGIGCIVTDEAVSDELVTSSGAGMVVKAGDPVALAKAMDAVMSNPQMVVDWKNSAYSFRPNMTADACARYFIQIIEYLLNGKNASRPLPPWIK